MKENLMINASTTESINIYGDGLRELLHNMGMPETEWGDIWGNEEEDLEDDGELQWFIGWFAGTAEALGVSCEALITLHEVPTVKKAPVKKKPVAKKAPVKKKPVAKKAPVKKKPTAAQAKKHAQAKKTRAKKAA